jgi:uncharacterized protein YbjT (DUF2867 family)
MDVERFCHEIAEFGIRRREAEIQEGTMYAVIGITGQVGGAVARNLLAQGKKVRAIVRDPAKAQPWGEHGCEVALAAINDPRALMKAFEGIEGAFVMLPPIFDPTPGFPEAREAIESIRIALSGAKPPRVVCLSTIGGHVTRASLLSQLHILENVLGGVGLPITFLRAAWFMENYAWDVQPAREKGAIPSFLQPLDKLFPMVATEDIGRVAAELLIAPNQPARVVELEGPKRIAPSEIAATFTKLLGKEVRMEAVPRDSWERSFRAQGMKNPVPRMQLLEGFNEGWIEFEGGEANSLKGTTPLETVLRSLLER